MEIKKKQSTRKRSAAKRIVVLLLLAVFLFPCTKPCEFCMGTGRRKRSTKMPKEHI